MERIAEFKKVSYKQFKKDWIDTFDDPDDAELREEEYIRYIYDSLNTPVRSTVGSAGYDFFSPLRFVLGPGGEIKIPTGIRAKMDEEYVLLMFPRSSLGFKYQLMMANTIPVIDASYYEADNMGHIFVKLVNKGDKTLTILQGDKFCQGIFVKYGITVDDNVEEKRSGGIGSTGR